MKDHTTAEIFEELWKRIEYDANVSEELATESNELQARIDKAIEYIPKIIISGKSEHSFNEFAVDFQQTKEGKILLDILKGKDDE